MEAILAYFEHIFIPSAQNLREIWLKLVHWRLQRILKLSYYESPGSKVIQWSSTSCSHKLHLLIKTTFITNFQAKIFKTFHEILFYHFSILQCRKIGQGQPKVVVWTILVVLTYPMLHTEFQGNRLIDSGVENFKDFYHIFAWWPYWSCDLDGLTIAPGGPTWNLITIGPVTFGEMFELSYHESPGS